LPGAILVEKKQPIELAQSICKLLADNELRKTMGKSGRTYVETNYSVNSVGLKYAMIIKDI
jgi:glycosyltransferase involved in cell wall biosynthesis